MKKEEVYTYDANGKYSEFNGVPSNNIPGEFSGSKERFYHDDEFNQRADFPRGKTKVKVKLKSADTFTSVPSILTPVIVVITTVATMVTVMAAPSHKHTFSEWITDIFPTCTQEGSRHIECTECGEILQTEVIPLADHDYPADFTVEKEPSCTEEGLAVIRCRVCGHIGASRTLEMTDHVASDYIVDAENTCTEKGHRHHECIYCGLILDEEDIPAKGHKYGSWKTTRTPTCQRTGIQERVCSNCGDKKTRSLAKVEHSFIINPDIGDSDRPVICRWCRKTTWEFNNLYYYDETDTYYLIYRTNGQLYQRIKK